MKFVNKKKGVFMKKFFSRKFIMAFLGMASGVSLGLIGQGNIVCEIVGWSLSIICAVVYMFVEGKIDANRVGQVADGAVNILQHAKASKEVVDGVEKIGDIVEKFVEGQKDE